MTEIVTQSVLIQGTFRLMRTLLNIKHNLEVLTKTATDVQKLPNDTGIYKPEHLCWGLATAKQTLASGICGTWTLRSRFFTGTGEVWKLVLMVSRQHNAWTWVCPWAYPYVKRQQIFFEFLSRGTSCLWFTAHLLHYMTSIPAFSVFHIHYIVSFIGFSCYTLEWDKTIFPIILTRRILQKLTASGVKSLILSFYPLSNIVLCLK